MHGGMVISPGRNFIFVHIPKTGGTAMTLALEARAKKDDILIADTPKAQRRKHRLADLRPAGRLWKHATFGDIRGVLPDDELRKMMVFTLVRNPWDRLVSYYHWLRAQRFDHPAVRLAQSVEFATFLHDPATQIAIRGNHYASYVKGAIDPLFVRLEHLEEDIAPVAAHLGFVPDMPRANASARARDWRGYYGDVDVALVADVCAGDIARFGYAFDK